MIDAERSTTTSEQPCREAEFEVVELPTRRKGGRPLKLTEERFHRLLALIREGHTNSGACRIEGITYVTFRLHIQKKSEWRAELAEASAVRDEVWRDYAIEMVKKAMPRNWVAAVTFLERKWPSEFSLRNVVRTESGERAHYDGLTREQVIALLEAAQTVELERPKGLELPVPVATENGTPCSVSPEES
jgi:hypothetical protein